jgi:uncharacterized protein YaiE (UPF0345 family)
MLQHNTYFDGTVQSIGFERNGRSYSTGVFAAGTFHFNTDAPERMTVTSGEILVTLPGQEPRTYPMGTSFEVPGKSGFDAVTTGPASYLCEFL